jgi:hypothetical protein
MMMRKLLILMLVFGMASLAQAAPVLSINGDTSVETICADCEADTIGVYSASVETDWAGYILVDDAYSGTQTYNPATDDVALGSPSTQTAAGSYGDTTAYTYDGWGYGYELEVGGVDDPPDDWLPTAGTWFTFSFTPSGDACDDCVAEWWIVLWDDANWTAGQDEVDILKVSFIPEPLTIALLGLGGLFLRRRK